MSSVLIETPAATPAVVPTARRAVEVRAASVLYPAADAPVRALQEVDLTIAQGELVSWMGPAGGGKATVLRVIADLEPIAGGEVLVNGVSPREAREARAYGYVFQAQ